MLINKLFFLSLFIVIWTIIYITLYFIYNTFFVAQWLWAWASSIFMFLILLVLIIYVLLYYFWLYKPLNFANFWWVYNLLFYLFFVFSILLLYLSLNLSINDASELERIKYVFFITSIFILINLYSWFVIHWINVHKYLKIFYALILSLAIIIPIYNYFNNKFSSFIDYNTYQMLERNNWLNNWLARSNENNVWYEKNKDKLKITQNWIEILWDIFTFEDKKIDESYTNKENYLYDKDQFLNKSNLLNNNLVTEWKKYIDFIPWNTENKLSFLIWVLWLETSDNIESTDKSDIFSSCYWNNTGDKILYISNNEIIPDKAFKNKDNCRIRTINMK